MAEMLPRVVYQMCVHGAYIVGSYAKKLAGEDIESNDYDLLVPILAGFGAQRLSVHTKRIFQLLWPPFQTFLPQASRQPECVWKYVLWAVPRCPHNLRRKSEVLL